MLLHMFFMIALTISVFLVGALLRKNILQMTDIGTVDFLESGYYVNLLEQKCDNLATYLYLLKRGDERTSDETALYLQYVNEFKSEETNFCFWCRDRKGNWYTNQPDSEAGQNFDVQTILMEAKTMGNYLLYDMLNREFGTDIRGLEDYFLKSRADRDYWKSDRVILVFGIDTQFSANDDLFRAKSEYERLHPWAKVGVMGAICSMMGWIVSLVYLTIVSGHKNQGEEISLSVIDRIKTEILIAAFIVAATELIFLMARLNRQQWDVSGLLVASGTISFLLDACFLIFYLSMVRRLKAEAMWKSSLVYWLSQKFSKLFRERSVTIQIVILFSIHMLVCFILAVWAFYYQKPTAFMLLLLFSCGEAYLFLHKAVERYQILKGVERISQGRLEDKINAKMLHGEERKLAEAVNNVGEGLRRAVEDSTKNERMKADLITNVSHDIKTPLTSIINYVSLLKREEIDNERVNNYIRILDEKSQRLKQLTEDLVEASRISSGNITLDMHKIDIVELVYQTGAEFNDKFEAKELTVVTKLPRESIYICADGRQLYRVIENLYNNAAKYALEKTRIFVEVTEEEGEVLFSMKNVSEYSLAAENSQTPDLTERFVRGDTSRTTEGTGLGLSIAKNLTTMMGGRFNIEVDGDLFKVIISFSVYFA